MKPSVIARGGEIEIVSVTDGMVTLEACGSPGAVLPAMHSIESLLCTAVPEVKAVRLVWPDGQVIESADSPDLAQAVQQVLDKEVNPSIAAHGGRVDLLNVTDGHVRIRLEGGCQGCNLAIVTVRQGIEPLLRQRIAGIQSVVDVTDHAAGTTPFFAPSKR